MTLGIGVVLGLLAAFFVGANWRNLGEVHWRLWPLCLAGLAIQLVLFSKNERLVAPFLSIAPELHVLSFALVLASLVANWRFRGVPVIVLGAALNLTVIVLNGGQMPRSTPPEPAPFRNVVAASEDTRLGLLGDWIRISSLPGEEFSPGDVLISLGGGIVAYGLARERRVSHSAPPVIGRR